MDAWVPIYRGPFAKVLVLRCRLQAEGYPVVIRDEIMKVVDPFITGFHPLSVELMVREEQVGEARDCLFSCLGSETAEPPQRAHQGRTGWLKPLLLLLVVVLLVVLALLSSAFRS